LEGRSRVAQFLAVRDINRKRIREHPAKVRIARGLRRETTATLRWIADRLKMGTWTHVSYRIQKIETP